MNFDNVQEAARGWEAARQAERQAHKELREAIREARKTHSLAAIGAVLGVSRQRVDQLSKES